MKKKIFTFVSLSILTLAVGVFSSFNLTKNEAVHASDYYQDADLSSKENLYKSLNKIINDGWKYCSYESLTKKLKTVDLDVEGLDYRHIKNRIVDMYSNITNFKPEDFGSYKDEGDAWNREHLIVKSWWGGKESGPNGEGGDAFNMFPTDGSINGMRGNYPFGIVDPNKISKRSANNFSLVGTSDSSTGYSGDVFEPNDEYKGDIARSYFYFATKNLDGSIYTKNEGAVTFSGSEKFMLTDYARKLFLSWNELDPVSPWERQRCENIYNYQKNRNPFIDHPEWATFIWGDDPIKVDSIVLSKDEISLRVNESAKINATVYPSNAHDKTVKWSSSNNSIVTVDNGEIKGVAQGDAIITCAAQDGSNVTSDCIVHVLPIEPPPEIKVISISLNHSSVSLDIGASADLTVTYNPENATKKGVTFSSSDVNIAKVDNNGRVIGYNGGSCVITATYTFDTNIKDSCNVTVNGSSGSGVNMPLVIGLSVGGGVLLLVGILVTILIVKKKV